MNTNISIKLDWRHLYALSLLASRDASRYILNGVCIQADPNGEPFAVLIATDGRRMGVYRQSIEEPLPPGTSVIVPLGLITASKPKGKSEILVEVDSSEGAGRRKITISTPTRTRSVSDTAVDGNYPNWRATMMLGEMVAVPQITVSLELVSEFVACAKAICPPRQGTGVKLRSHAGTGSNGLVHSVIFLSAPEFFGIIMPIRDDADRPVPEWARVIPAKPAATATVATTATA